MPGRPAPEIHPNNDGSVTIQYHPVQNGCHELNLNYNEGQVDGTPFRCVVDSVGNGFVTAYGPGLNFAASGVETEFTVVGGGKDLAITVDGPAKADPKKKASAGAATTYTFLPISPGEYLVNIKAKGKHIHGSPFSTKVSGEGRKRSQVSLPATSCVPLGGKEVDLTHLTGNLKTPSGATEPCLLKKLPDGRLGIASFQAKKKGTYQVEVLRDGKAFPGSPFKVSVGDRELCQPSHVKVAGPGLKEAVANKWNTFNIDVTGAGIGSLGLSMEGPHRADIDVKEDSAHPGVYAINFKPHEPAIYLCNIKFGDEHITGSPLMLNVGGQPSGRVRETVLVDIAAVQPCYPAQKCEFQLKIPDTDPLDMEATLTAPSGKSELCEIRDMPESLYDINFTPSEEGIHTVSLKHKGLHISGSPFQYTVGNLPAGGTHKVEIGGTGLEKGEVKLKNHFNIYTREAGGGSLAVAVEGPSKATIQAVDRGHGYTTVSYTVSEPGDYGIHVKYNGDHTPDSPTNVYIVPDSADAKKVTLHGIKDRGNQPNMACTFTINLNGAEGTLHAHLDTPSGTVEDVFIQEMDRDLHALRFIPKENGIFYVTAKLNEAHIPGSPFPILVGQMGADAALVLAKGDGLEKGETGKPAKFVAVTTNAGHGTLNVSVEGPSRVAIVCTEVDEGYEFSYVPMAPGDYMINIKYCNVTIAGCPTKATITGKGKPSEILESSGIVVETVEKKAGAKTQKRFTGDASKIVTSGNGLKKAFANRPCTFNLDVKDAGNGLLMVGIISPTGNPPEELSFKKQPGRATVYIASYKLKEKGDHSLIVRWGNDDIPGSPFTLTVA